MNYYNEFDPKAAQWLRHLVDSGTIPFGTVDERSITEVEPDELKQYTQCHFFAGIAGWSHALQLAKWPTARNVWTGSCPCQPFSAAGNQKGKADERHLWPAWFNLIRECRPPTIFGEQVAAAIAHGWLDEVATDLEREDYTIGAAVLPACSVGAPHKRDRLWFVANSCSNRCNQRRECISAQECNGPVGNSGVMADPYNTRLERRLRTKPYERQNGQASKCMRTINGDVADTKCIGQSRQGELEQPLHSKQTSEEQANRVDNASPRSWKGQWIMCPDGKQRIVEPSIRLLAHGISGRMAIQRTVKRSETEVQETYEYNRVAALKAFGNAIVPQVAAEFIKAYMEM